MTTPRLPREDLTAAMAARRELGPEYDEAFIEAVVGRIEEALESRTGAPARAAAPRPPRARGGADAGSLALAIISLVAAVPLTAIGVVNAGVPGLLFAAAVIVLVNVTYTFRPHRG